MYQPVHAIILVCLIDHASCINFYTSIWQCFIAKINLQYMKMYMLYFNMAYIDAHYLCVLFFFKVLSKMATYFPVSIFKGSIPVLNCDIRERRRRNIHLIKLYVSGSNISLNIMYVFSLGVFSIVVSI